MPSPSCPFVSLQIQIKSVGAGKGAEAFRALNVFRACSRFQLAAMPGDSHIGFIAVEYSSRGEVVRSYSSYSMCTCFIRHLALDALLV
jgi:hypothetical protein